MSSWKKRAANTCLSEEVDALAIIFSSFDKEIFFFKQTACCSKFIKNMFMFCSNPFSESKCENIFLVLQDHQTDDQARSQEGLVKGYSLGSKK